MFSRPGNAYQTKISKKHLKMEIKCPNLLNLKLFKELTAVLFV